MKVKPIDERILVVRVEENPDPNKPKSMIVIPESIKEKPVLGLVVAIGNDTEANMPVPIKELLYVGDTIIFSKHAGEEVIISGVDHLIISRSDLLAVVEENG